MDQIDRNLLDAWNRISGRVRRDRLEALHRSRRRLMPALTRPMRPWCLCLRASDTRINDYRCVINPSRAIQERIEHEVVLSGTVIRDLCKPVMIPWPGIDWIRAAAMLGRHEESIRSWITKGVLRARYDSAHSHGKRGKPVPIVYAPSPLDPNANQGQAPDRIWGTLWQTLWQRLLENYELVVTRAPIWRNYRGDLRQRGWKFICPGRFNPDGTHSPCNRQVTRLFGPQSVWTLPQAAGIDQGFDVAAEAEPEPRDFPGAPRLRLAGTWHPGLSDPVKATGPRSFACHHCWRVRYTTLTDRSGWNEFITHISGGLLYGYEVKRPLQEAPHKRKRRYVHHARPAPRRQEVLAGLLEGLTYKQIAKTMGVTYGTVHAHVKTIYKEHVVHSRAELVRKLIRVPDRPDRASRAGCCRFRDRESGSVTGVPSIR